MSGAERDSANCDPRIARLSDLVIERLTELLEISLEGDDAATRAKSAAPAAYLQAAIRLLKDLGAWRDEDGESGLEAALAAMPDFDDDDDPEASDRSAGASARRGPDMGGRRR